MSDKLTGPSIIQLSSMPLTTLVYLVDPATPDQSNKMTLADLFALMRLAVDGEDEGATQYLGNTTQDTTIQGNNVNLRGPTRTVLTASDTGLIVPFPIFPRVVVFKNGSSVEITATSFPDFCAPEYIYTNSNSAPIAIFAPVELYGAQVRITNLSANPLVLTCPSAPTGSFISGSMTPVNTLTIAPGETITITSNSLNSVVTAFWVLTGRSTKI